MDALESFSPRGHVAVVTGGNRGSGARVRHRSRATVHNLSRSLAAEWTRHGGYAAI